MERMEMDYISKNVSSIFSKFSHPSLGQNQKCTMGFSSCKKMIAILVLNFKVMFSAQVKVRKRDFCIVLARKKKRYRDRERVPLQDCQPPRRFIKILSGNNIGNSNNVTSKCNRSRSCSRFSIILSSLGSKM